MTPDFLGIGAQKAGTTWLYQNLRYHQCIYMPQKEIHYFDQESQRIHGVTLCEIPFEASNPRCYQELFSGKPSGSLAGEITPAYAICEDDEVCIMREVNPGLKILFMLRNPVDRAWSQCRMKINRRRLASDSGSIRGFLESPLGLPRGFYIDSIKKFLKYFSADQIFIGFYDSLLHDPLDLLRQVEAFLGIPACHYDDILLNARINSDDTPQPMPADIRSYLSSAYRGEIERLASLFGSYTEHWMTTLVSDPVPASMATENKGPGTSGAAIWLGYPRSLSGCALSRFDVSQLDRT